MHLARCGVFRFTIKNKYNNSTLKLHNVDSFFYVVGGDERSRGVGLISSVTSFGSVYTTVPLICPFAHTTPHIQTDGNIPDHVD